MSIKLQTQVDALEQRVKELWEQMEQLSKLLRPVSVLDKKPRGRPPNKPTGHIQP